MNSINEAFNEVFNELYRSFPCTLLKMNNKIFKVVYSDSVSVFMVDIATNRPIVMSKLTVYRRKSSGYDYQECKRDTVDDEFEKELILVLLKRAS